MFLESFSNSYKIEMHIEICMFVVTFMERERKRVLEREYKLFHNHLKLL